MNRVNLIGRITSRPELRYTTNGIAFTRFNLAINHGYGDNKKTDFIPIIIWKKQAENVCNYLDKGSLVAIDGRIQTGTYEDKNGKKSYTFDVVADNVEFLDSKKEQQEQSNSQLVANAMTDDYDPYQLMGEQLENEYVQLQLDDDCDIE
jgi:single-strand DNA-binding protein